jgi:hypothetical protein
VTTVTPARTGVAPASPRDAGREQELPERPPISAPADLRGASELGAEAQRVALQPRLGLLGLLLVVPVALVIAVGAGGPENSLLVFAPLVTFSLPVVAMVAFWWEDWPGSTLRPGWSGLLDTVVIIVAAVLLTMVGQIVVGHLDVGAIFDPSPPSGAPATFPATLPLAGAAFVAMLQLTLVCEGWPLRRLPRLSSGVAAIALSWLLALVVYYVVLDVHPPPGSGLSSRSGPLSGGELGALLVLVGAWQVWLFVGWRGWPFSGVQRRVVRLAAGNLVVLGGALASYLVLHGLGDVRASTITAAAGSFIAAGLVVSMLLEGWLGSLLSPSLARAAGLAALLGGAAVLDLALTAYADSVDWTRATPQEWVAHVALNAIGVAVILHVAIGRRWPFDTGADH